MSGFANPLVGGGGGLEYPSIHSPNFITQVSGWTINKDGSAEFNNLTIRGTFHGTDFIINSKGAFFYSGTPAAGNLIGSAFASVNGTDDFGNSYVAGVATYGAGGTSSYSQLLNGVLNLTNGTQFWAIELLTSGCLDISDVSGDPVLLLANAGDPANPGFAETWHAPVLGGSGFGNNGSNVTFKYRLQPDGMIELQGELAATANYTAGAAIVTLPAHYRPAAQTDVPVTIVTGAGPAGSYLDISTAGVLSLGSNLVIGNVVVVAARFRAVA